MSAFGLGLLSAVCDIEILNYPVELLEYMQTGSLQEYCTSSMLLWVPQWLVTATV